MALPKGYSNFDTYLEDGLTFLKKYSWIYNTPNTHILSNKTLQDSSSDWIGYFMQISNENLNRLAAGEIENDAPTTLKDFFGKLKSLQPSLERYVTDVNVIFPKNAPVGIKKKHEIISLTPVIGEICQKTNCSTVFDFGCGLGYISQILHQQFDYRVIGIEGCEKKVTSAEEYRKNFYCESADMVQYIHHFITDASVEYLRDLYSRRLSINDNVCIIGLHVCADLCVTVLDLFQKLDFVKALVIMPCCYHRMLLNESKDSSESFLKFPCSEAFRRKYNYMNGSRFLKRTFLRVAAQRSNENWKDLTSEEHEFRGKNCLFRAIVQEIVQQENWRIKRLKRKSGLRMDDSYNIKLAAHNLKDTHLLTTQSGVPIDAGVVNKKIFEKWNSYKHQYIIIEAIIVLQNTLQSICENIILLDRIEYLKEIGVNGFVRKVTDDVISPRCYGIVAIKE